MATALDTTHRIYDVGMGHQLTQIIDPSGNAVNVTDLVTGSVTSAVAAAVGAAAAGFTAVNTISNGLVKTVITVPATAFVVVGGAAGVGELGLKVYDFPEGQILLLGGGATFTVTEADANITATAVVDVSVGTAAVSGGDDALGADATDDDLLDTGSLTMSSSTATGSIISNTTVAKFDGTATAIDAYLNVSVQDAGISNDSATVTVSGTINLFWMLLGDK